ncbi:MAG: hypothetical protein Q7R39_00770 [Dehalococcoidia bacterium]|nr:hypothetical protein [Dehalococcoidia bacterium]
MSSGGCSPAGAPTNVGQKVRQYIHEFASMGPEDFRKVAETLKATLNSAAAYTGQATFRAPATHNFVIEKILAHLVFKAPTTETASIVGIGNPSTIDRMALKAMNCKVDLQNTDRAQKVIETNSLSLAALHRAAGGEPMEFEPGHILLAGEQVQMDLSLIDTTASVVGGDTEYGLVLVGTLIRVKNS